LWRYSGNTLVFLGPQKNQPWIESDKNLLWMSGMYKKGSSMSRKRILVIPYLNALTFQKRILDLL